MQCQCFIFQLKIGSNRTFKSKVLIQLFAISPPNRAMGTGEMFCDQECYTSFPSIKHLGFRYIHFVNSYNKDISKGDLQKI